MYRAELVYERRRHYTILVFIALLPLLLLAAIREHSIGVDMPMYVLPWFEDASRYESFSRFCTNITDSKEYLYYGLVFYSNKIFGNLFSLLFIQQLFIHLGVVISLFYFKKKYNISVWYGYAFYLILYYNESLCIMRQSIAVSIGLIAMITYFEKKYIIFIILSIIAFFFHNSIIAFLLSIPIVEKINESFKSKMMKIIMYCLFFILLSSFSFVISIISISASDSRFAERLIDGETNEGGYLTIAMWAVFVFSSYIYKFLFNKSIGVNTLWIYPIMGFIFVILAKQSIYFGRIAYPFLLCLIISLSGAFKKSIFKIPILLLNLAYWYYVNAISDTYGTFEYEFDRFLNL